MVVVVDVSHELPFEVGHVLEFLEVKELGLEHGEEALYGRVVETVALPGHTLGDPVLAQLRRERPELVLPALIGVKDRPRVTIESLDGLVQHLANERIPRTIGHRIGDDFAVRQVHHR